MEEDLALGPSALCIEDGLRIDLTGAQGERLHRLAVWLRFSYGDQRGQGGVERRQSTPIEALTVTTRALARQGRPGPLRIVSPVDQSPEPHQESARSRIAARHDPVEDGYRRDKTCRFRRSVEVVHSRDDAARNIPPPA